MNTAADDRCTGFWTYSWRVLLQIGRDLKTNVVATALTIIAAAGVAVFQIRYLAASAGASRESAVTAIERTIAVLLAYVLVQAIRAPWQVYRRGQGKLHEHIGAVEAEHRNAVGKLDDDLQQERQSRDAERLDYERELQRLRELLGQPDLMLECMLNPDQSIRKQGDFLLTLRNAGKPLVSNIAAPEIRVPMGKQIIRAGQEMREAFPVEEAASKSSPTEWVIEFLPLKDLAEGDSTTISYIVQNSGVFQRHALAYVMSNCGYPGPNWRDGFVVVLPLVFECLSNGSRWRLKYDLCYSLIRKKPWVQSREFSKLDE